MTKILDQNQASQLRFAIVELSTSAYHEFTGSEVYSVTDKGIVIAKEQMRFFFPWHRVVQFTYHQNDDATCKVIQGW